MDQPPPLPEISAPKVPKEPAMSLLARLLNVFAIPGHVFEEIKSTRNSTANWLLPALLASVVGALSAIVMYSQPAFFQQSRAMQAQYLEQKVKAGQMTKPEADQMQTMVDKIMTPRIMKTAGAVGSVVVSFASVFGWGLVLLFLGRKFLRVRFTYLKAVEMTGLATMISVLGMVVKLLLIYNVAKMFSTGSLGLTVSDFDPDNPNYLLLVAINVFQFWFIGLLAVGLARLASVPLPRTLYLLLACWMIRATFLLLIGLGAMVL